MIIIKRDSPKIFGGKMYLVTPQENGAINSIANSISINRSYLVRLLQKHDVEANENMPKEELLQILGNTYSLNGQFAKEYHNKFVQKFSNIVPINDEEDSDTGSGAGSGAGAGMMGGTDGYTAATVGIMNAIASIFNVFNKPDTTGQQMQYNQQILALAAEKEAKKKRNQTIAIVATIVAVIGIAIFTIYYAKRKKAL